MAASVLRGGARVASACIRATSKTGSSSPVCSIGVLPQTSIQKRWLPLCTVETNVQKDAVADDILPGLSKLISETLNKPEKLISVTLRTDVPSIRDGSAAPSAVVQVWSIGVFDAERNPGYSKVFTDFLAPKLGVPADRIVLFFHPVTKTDAGHLLYAEQQN